MRADGTSTFRVTSGTGGAPVWSPGGTMLAYASYHDGELWVVRIDGNGLRKLTTGGGRDPVWEPAIR
jgi:Tol biopolymer transport system component